MSSTNVREIAGRCYAVSQISQALRAACYLSACTVRCGGGSPMCGDLLEKIFIRDKKEFELKNKKLMFQKKGGQVVGIY